MEKLLLIAVLRSAFGSVYDWKLNQRNIPALRGQYATLAIRLKSLLFTNNPPPH